MVNVTFFPSSLDAPPDFPSDMSPHNLLKPRVEKKSGSEGSLVLLRTMYTPPRREAWETGETVGASAAAFPEGSGCPPPGSCPRGPSAEGATRKGRRHALGHTQGPQGSRGAGERTERDLSVSAAATI